MSMQDYDTAIHLMKQYPDKMDFVGPRPAAWIEAAEQALGLIFPPTYRRFLLEYGAGSFGAENLYGIIDNNFENAGVPDGIWCTLTNRREFEFPANYVEIYAVGYGEIFCLEINTQDGEEAPVVVFNPGLPIASQHHEVVAADFGAILLDLVQQEIEFIESNEDEAVE